MSMLWHHCRCCHCRSSPTAPRQQINAATAWLDASSIYGQSPETARTIRAGRHLPVFDKVTNSSTRNAHALCWGWCLAAASNYC